MTGIETTPRWSETEMLAALRAEPGRPLAPLARDAGWSRARLRRRVVQWRQNNEIINGHHAAADLITVAGAWPASGQKGGRVAAVLAGAAGTGLAAIGAAATISYSLASTGPLMAALAATADAVALVLPSLACALWQRHRWGLAVVAWAMWIVAAGITANNIGGFIDQRTDSFLAGREVASLDRSVVLERLGHLRAERSAITEQRPAAAIIVAIQNSTRAELEGQRTALAMAKRRDELDRDLAALEPQLTSLPTVTAIDPSAALLSSVLGLSSDADLRRLRLTLLLILPLCSGLLLAVAFAVGTSGERR